MADSSGIAFTNVEGQLPSYSGVVAANAGYATPTDLVVLQNPAPSGVIVRLIQVRFLAVATAASFFDAFLQKRIQLDTGGTATVVTPTVHDTNDGAAKALFQFYTVAPTLNGSATNVRTKKAFLAAAGTPVLQDETVWQWGERSIRAPHARPGEQFALNFAGAGLPAGFSGYITFEWSESGINTQTQQF